MLLQTCKRRQNAGFTLIELLTVIAIIAVLAALVAAAVFRVMGPQAQRRTEQNLVKLASALDQQMKAVYDQSREDVVNNRVPVSIVNTLGNDTDLQRAVWIKLQIYNQFPMTFAEATSGVTFNGTLVPPSSTYQNLFSGVVSTGSIDEQSACLYAALSQARRGMSFNPDTLGGTAVGNKTFNLTNGGTTSLKVFVDGWGTSIGYVRMNNLGEFSAAPYVSANPNPPNSIDPQDPAGRLQLSVYSTIAGDLNSSLLPVPSPPVAALAQQPPGIGSNWNYAGYIYSAGPDKTAYTGDDLLSFRLRQDGGRGN